MTSPPPTLPARVAAIAPLKRRGERLLGRLLRRSTTVVVPRRELIGADPFLEVGRRLRAARESQGLSLRQLAQETRISITVLEALEKGWRDRLPEAAYLRTMLALLEQHLALEQGSLQLALPPRRSRSLRSSLKAHGERVSLSSIELVASWQGALLYGLLCLLLIYGLNRQQRRLVDQGLLPLHTVAAQPSSASEAGRAGERDRARLLGAYPELRPLERARRGQALELLRRHDQARVPVNGAVTPQAAASAESSAGPSRIGPADTAAPGSAPAAAGPSPQLTAPEPAGGPPAGNIEPAAQDGPASTPRP